MTRFPVSFGIRPQPASKPAPPLTPSQVRLLRGLELLGGAHPSQTEAQPALTRWVGSLFRRAPQAQTVPVAALEAFARFPRDQWRHPAEQSRFEKDLLHLYHHGYIQYDEADRPTPRENPTAYSIWDKGKAFLRQLRKQSALETPEPKDITALQAQSAHPPVK